MVPHITLHCMASVIVVRFQAHADGTINRIGRKLHFPARRGVNGSIHNYFFRLMSSRQHARNNKLLFVERSTCEWHPQTAS